MWHKDTRFGDRKETEIFMDAKNVGRRDGSQLP